MSYGSHAQTNEHQLALEKANQYNENDPTMLNNSMAHNVDALEEDQSLSLQLTQRPRPTAPTIEWRFSPSHIKIHDRVSMVSSPNTMRQHELRDLDLIKTLQQFHSKEMTKSLGPTASSLAITKRPRSLTKALDQETEQSFAVAHDSLTLMPHLCNYLLDPNSSSEANTYSDNLPSSPLKKETKLCQSLPNSSQLAKGLSSMSLEPAAELSSTEMFTIEDLAALGSSLFTDPIDPAITGAKVAKSIVEFEVVELSDQVVEELCGALDEFLEADNILPKDKILEAAPPIQPTLPALPYYRFQITNQIVLSPMAKILQGHVMYHIGTKDAIDDAQSIEAKVHIIGDWALLDFDPNAIIHVIKPKILYEANELCVDNDSGFLIVFPDYLISTTTVADSISCIRRAVLSTRTQPSIEDNKPSASLVCGLIVHDIVEATLLAGVYSVEQTEALLRRLVVSNMQRIYCCEQDEEHIYKEVMRILTFFQTWCKRYLGPNPSQASLISDQINSNWPPESKFLSICNVMATEENIWSHAFGLKGKIDASVYARFRKGVVYESVLVPLELKTSKVTTNVAHRAQTLLYTLLIGEKHDIDNVEFGLLYYITANEILRVTASRNELRNLIMARNRLAIANQATEKLPAPITNEHVCRQCFQLESCLGFHKFEENGIAETSAYPLGFRTRYSHLVTDSELREARLFFEKWNRLIGFEERESLSLKTELWTKSPYQAIKSGRCLFDVELQSCVQENDEYYPAETKRFICKFTFKDSPPTIVAPNQMMRGEPVVISNCALGKYGIAIGFVQGLWGKERAITVFTDRPIQPGKGFRIDKDELVMGYGLMRANLVKLFAQEYEALMRIIVLSKLPTFEPNIPIIPSFLIDAYNKLDTCQQLTIQRIMQTNNLLLILGMPGTGKSTTLVLAIRLLVSLGQSILISSYTHAAVDNILKKLHRLDPNINCVRLGNSEKVDEELEKFLLQTKTFHTVASLENFYLNAKIVGCTSLAINHPLLMKRRFDYCIVDEASQINLPTCIGPLRLAKKSILVGDHYQLPPLVRSREANAGGMNVSLFELLVEKYPDCVVTLELQYRMNHVLMDIANLIIYNNRLKCGSDIVREGKLEIDATGVHCSRCDNLATCWIYRAIDPSLPAVFVDMDHVEALETAVGLSFHNEKEAAVVKKLVHGLVLVGVAKSEVCVITPYKPQIRLLAELEGVEVATVDQFQGKDKSCVILSLVRCNYAKNVGCKILDHSYHHHKPSIYRTEFI